MPRSLGALASEVESFQKDCNAAVSRASVNMETSMPTGGDCEGSAALASAGCDRSGAILVKAGAAQAGPAAAAQ